MDTEQALLTNIQTQTLQPLPSHISAPHVLLLASQQLWMQPFISWTTFTYISLEKTCTANVDRQNMPLSRILQGNWNQKRVSPTAACIILLWKAGKFERLLMKADERTGLNVRQETASNSGGVLVSMKCFLMDLGWAVLHTAEGNALSLSCPAAVTFQR